MSIKEGKIVGYTYDVNYDGGWIHSSDDRFDTEEEAREDAEIYIDTKIAEWDFDGAWHENDSRNYFKVAIIDIIGSEDEEEDD